MQQRRSGDMQGVNSPLSNGTHHDQQHLHPTHHHHHHHQSQIRQNATFDPTSQDDFLEQIMLSSSWTDLKSPWGVVDLLTPDNNNNNTNSTTTRDLLSDEAAAPCSQGDDVPAFHFDDSVILASKMRQHQISRNSSPPAVAKLMMQQHHHHQQMMMVAARGGMMGGLPLSLGNGGENDIVDASTLQSQSGDGSVQALFNGFTGSLHGSDQPQQFHHLQGRQIPEQSFGAPGMNQTQAQGNGSAGRGGGGGCGNTPAQPRQRVRARRGQATDPHSIAERLRRERIAERMKALQELVPNPNKADKASMLDEIIDYVKFLQLQVKVLSMSRLGVAAAVVAPLVVADVSSERGGDCIQANGRNPKETQMASASDNLTVTEHQVAKLMEEDMGSAMQYLQGKGLCLMPISLASAISTANCHSSSRSPLIGGSGCNNNNNGNGIAHNNNYGGNHPPLLPSNGEGPPTSPSMSVLTVQSANMGNCGTDGSVKDAASVSKP